VVQTCVVHLIRNALRPVARRDAGAVAKELKKVYTAVDADAALDALAAFADTDLGRKYPQSVRVFEDAWAGSSGALLRRSPLRTVRAACHGTRLKQTQRCRVRAEVLGDVAERGAWRSRRGRGTVRFDRLVRPVPLAA